ncbi:putative FmdB family regulatory protein [Paucibacter oligotrophus]|uniref:Putative FmdB family regulatory protein n=1 Tax=Roseateles oligotrophus TaxID=1769250 RepID=A0A840LBI0_9BURK|nr:zinc ribbon domain-containing protein [Roseateles oligotrophus]MBB4842687.1 putative FmdB family regulatory protein [Roseateles oligotrophus]
MPIYDYRCRDCGLFDALRPMAERDRPAPCPGCAEPSERAWVEGSRLREMAPARLLAMAGNERAAHEPQRSADYTRLRHPAGCGCCQPGRRGSTVTAANGAKAFPSKRPWMISH